MSKIVLRAIRKKSLVRCQSQGIKRERARVWNEEVVLRAVLVNGDCGREDLAF